MKWTLLGNAALCAALLVACGGSTDSDGSGGQPSGGAGGTSGSGGTSGGGAGGTSGAGGSGGYCESFVPCCDSAGNPVSPICPSGSPECPPGSSWPSSGTCSPAGAECTPQKGCAADEWCDYPDNLCGAGVAGKCVKRPQGCDLLYAPVCTCEGKEAGNECSGQSGGWDVAAKGGCAPPQGMFACGQLFCMTGKQYCQLIGSDIAGYPDDFACKELPAACGSSPSCACVSGEMCGSLCKPDASGNLQLICPGG